MVTHQQVRKPMNLIQGEQSLALAAAKAGMDEKTAGKYRRLGRLSSQCQQAHTWMTRQDRFAEVWPEIRGQAQLYHFPVGAHIYVRSGLVRTGRSASGSIFPQD